MTHNAENDAACPKCGSDETWVSYEDWTANYCGACRSYSRPIPPDMTDEPVVCIAHGRFIPCRKDGEHRYTSNPYWVKAVRDYHASPIEDLTWEPAYEEE